MTIGIYCIEHIESGKKYIGKSKNIEKRLNTHKSLLKSDKMSKSVNSLLWRAVKKYSLEAFKFWVVEELEFLDPVKLSEREIHWMDFYKTLDRDFGYNLMRDSRQLVEFCPETIEKMSKAKLGKYVGENNPNFGKKRPQEVKDKVSKANKGRKRTEEQLAKIRENRKPTSPETIAKMSLARLGEKNPNFGKDVSQETRDKIRKANTGRVTSDETKKKLSDAGKGRIMQQSSIDKRVAARIKNRKSDGFVYLQYAKDLELLKIWYNHWDAVKEGFDIRQVSRVCRGVIKTHKGFVWERVKHDEFVESDYTDRD